VISSGLSIVISVYQWLGITVSIYQHLLVVSNNYERHVQIENSGWSMFIGRYKGLLEASTSD